ncbi:MAG TPA: hypothetical protein VNX25_06455, partial [Verrucomicrobiae bacterium]|nr:hypothetical protein [Verrucomicrobiae bacterium]
RIFNDGGVVQFSARAEELHLPVDRRAEGCDTCHGTSAALRPVRSMVGNRHYRNGAGEGVIAVTAPIYNDSDCFAAPCHYHPQSAQLLGTLDIGISAQPLDDALRSLATKMGISAVMVLVLSSAGVVAVLRRSVIVPVRRLAEHARLVEEGRSPAPLPPFGDELDVIARVLDAAGRGKG